MSQVLVDSNVLQYGVKKEFAGDVAKVFESLQAAGKSPAVLAYTNFEVYRGLAYVRINDMKALLDAFTSIDVDKDTYRVAAALTTCYKEHVATKIYYDRYSIGDVLLAAGAFRYGTTLITANSNDFPRPFFEEIQEYTVTNSATRKSITITLLKPKNQILEASIEDCFPKNR